MNDLSKFLVESILSEAVSVNKIVVVYAGRFQPFHKGHFATYTHLIKKFGKDNVYIGTSNKTANNKSPFNFNEKKEIMTTMFGVPSNKIVEVKNPYRPMEIMGKFNEDTTAFVTVVGEKDEARLGGKYFEKWKDGKDLEGYRDRGYVYISPAQPNAISGTDVRNNLGNNVDNNTKMDFFSKRAYPKFNKKIYDLITKKLSESYEPLFISKEVIEEWVATELHGVLEESSKTTTSGGDADDGPNYLFPNFKIFDKVSKNRAQKIGYEVFRQIMLQKYEDYYEHPIYPNGPVKAVTPFPAGVIGKTTATNQKDFLTSVAYDKWFKHVTRAMALAGYSLVRDKDAIEKRLATRDLSSYRQMVKKKDPIITPERNITEGMGLAMGYPSKEQLKQKMDQLAKMRNQLDKHTTGDERYTPIEEDKIEGGLSAGMGLEDIANHHKVDIDELMKELQNGIKVEMEHTIDKETAKEIALDHLYEDPKYYTKLSTIEKNEILDAETLNEIPMADLVKIDQYADKQLNPFDVVLTDKHFFERLTVPRNQKEITQAELIGFFKRLGKNKKKFAEFLNQYGQIVAKDNRTKINIPFMKQANKAIAKTIMRKDDFKTPSPEYKFEALAVSGGKVHKYITGKNLTLKGKKYPDIEFEVLSIDNRSQLVKLKVLAPKSVFGQELNVPFKTIRRGPFIKTDTNISEDITLPVNVGDTILMGKFKNKKVVVKTIGKDEYGMPTINGKKVATFRMIKEGLLTEGGAYGHMNHPFDTEINLTFGQLKDIVNRALDGELELAREKTDGQALAISWVNGKLVAARNKGHLANKGANALDIKGVATKFAGRGELEKAYNFAMNDLSSAISKLSDAQKNKIFKDGACFMNLEVIYPTSVNVIPYGQALLVFHGTMEYNEKGEAIGENQQAARILAGMIKQVNQNVQSTYTIQGPPVTKLPKSQKLSSLKGKYNGKIAKLQSQFKLSDNDGIADYHQAWWTDFVQKKSPVALDNNTLMGLVKRWAFYDKGFRLDAKNIIDTKVLAWAQKVDKEDHAKIAKQNIRPFEDIFLGVGAEVLSFMSSVLAANPDAAVRNMKDRLDKMISDVQKSGDPKLINKLKLELERLNSIGGKEKIVPNEGIVFVYNGNTFKLTGTFAPLNQILGMFYGK